MAEVNVHAATEMANQIYELVRQRAPDVDLAADEAWRKAVWRAGKRLAEAREDELLLLLSTAPRRAAAAE